MTTEKQATEQINTYTGLYHNLAFAHYKLARQQGKTIDESLDIVAQKIVVAVDVAISARKNS